MNESNSVRNWHAWHPERERERVGRGTCDKFKSRLAPKNFENSNVRLLMMIVGTRVFKF